jgi:hypothetical protein
MIVLYETNDNRRKVKCAAMNVKIKHPLPLSFSQTYIYRNSGGGKGKGKGKGWVFEHGVVGNIELGAESLAPISISISIPKFLYHGMQRLRWIMHAECRFPISCFLLPRSFPLTSQLPLLYNRKLKPGSTIYPTSASPDENRKTSQSSPSTRCVGIRPSRRISNR